DDVLLDVQKVHEPPVPRHRRVDQFVQDLLDPFLDLLVVHLVHDRDPSASGEIIRPRRSRGIHRLSGVFRYDSSIGRKGGARGEDVEGGQVLTLYRVKLSTNVERVALAMAHRGLRAESHYVPFEERAEIRRVSGQDLVPVLVDDGKVVIDSMEIVRYLEEHFPNTPHLYPAEPARKADCLVFIDWFNRVWKRPPNEITAELEK